MHCQTWPIADSSLNRVLKVALHLLLRVANNLDNQRGLAELLLVFEEIPDIPAASLPWQHVGFDRLNERYRPAFRLAALFLKRLAPDVTSGRAAGFSLFFTRTTSSKNSSAGLQFGHSAPGELKCRFRGATLSCRGRVERCKRLCHAAGRGRHEEWPGGLDHRHQMEAAFPGRSAGGRVAVRPVPDVRLCEQLGCSDVVLLYPHHAALGASGGTRASYSQQTH